MINPYFNVFIKIISFKTENTERTKRRKICFPKEIVENADLHKPVLNKIITTKK